MKTWVPIGEVGDGLEALIALIFYLYLTGAAAAARADVRH